MHKAGSQYLNTVITKGENGTNHGNNLIETINMIKNTVAQTTVTADQKYNFNKKKKKREQ